MSHHKPIKLSLAWQEKGKEKDTTQLGTPFINQKIETAPTTKKLGEEKKDATYMLTSKGYNVIKDKMSLERGTKKEF